MRRPPSSPPTDPRPPGAPAIARGCAALLLGHLAACQAIIDVDHPLHFGLDASASPTGGTEAVDAESPLGGGTLSDADGGEGHPPTDALRPPRGDVAFGPPPVEDFRVPDRDARAPRPDAHVGPPPPPPPEADCIDGDDDDGDGLIDCADPDCAAADCDDGDACTFDDRCDPGAGRCGGTRVTCESSPCMLRACNGGPSCSETPVAADSGCPDDGDPCTDNLCDGAGACTPRRRADGAQCNGQAYEFRCCAGACVNVFSDGAHCGGCGISCDGRACVADFVGIVPRVSCVCQGLNVQCQAIHPDYTCYQNRCNCLSDAACGPGMQCVNIANSPNTCLFP